MTTLKFIKLTISKQLSALQSNITIRVINCFPFPNVWNSYLLTVRKYRFSCSMASFQIRWHDRNWKWSCPPLVGLAVCVLVSKSGVMVSIRNAFYYIVNLSRNWKGLNIPRVVHASVVHLLWRRKCLAT